MARRDRNQVHRRRQPQAACSQCSHLPRSSEAQDQEGDSRIRRRRESSVSSSRLASSSRTTKLTRPSFHLLADHHLRNPRLRVPQAQEEEEGSSRQLGWRGRIGRRCPASSDLRTSRSDRVVQDHLGRSSEHQEQVYSNVSVHRRTRSRLSMVSHRYSRHEHARRVSFSSFFSLCLTTTQSSSYFLF